MQRSWTTRIPARASFSAAPSCRMPSWNQTVFGRHGKARISSRVARQILGAPEHLDDVGRLGEIARACATVSASCRRCPANRRVDRPDPVAAGMQIRRHVVRGLRRVGLGAEHRHGLAPRGGSRVRPASSSTRWARQSLMRASPSHVAASAATISPPKASARQRRTPSSVARASASRGRRGRDRRDQPIGQEQAGLEPEARRRLRPPLDAAPRSGGRRLPGSSDAGGARAPAARSPAALGPARWRPASLRPTARSPAACSPGSSASAATSSRRRLRQRARASPRRGS